MKKLKKDSGRFGIAREGEFCGVAGSYEEARERENDIRRQYAERLNLREWPCNLTLAVDIYPIDEKVYQDVRHEDDCSDVCPCQNGGEYVAE